MNTYHLAIYAALVRLAHPRTGSVTATQEDLSFKAKMSRWQSIAIIDELVEWGYIEILFRARGPRPSSYKLLPAPVSEVLIARDARNPIGRNRARRAQSRGSIARDARNYGDTARNYGDTARNPTPGSDPKDVNSKEELFELIRTGKWAELKAVAEGS